MYGTSSAWWLTLRSGHRQRHEQHPKPEHLQRLKEWKTQRFFSVRNTNYFTSWTYHKYKLFHSLTDTPSLPKATSPLPNPLLLWRYTDLPHVTLTIPMDDQSQTTHIHLSFLVHLYFSLPKAKWHEMAGSRLTITAATFFTSFRFR